MPMTGRVPRKSRPKPPGGRAGKLRSPPKGHPRIHRPLDEPNGGALCLDVRRRHEFAVTSLWTGCCDQRPRAFCNCRLSMEERPWMLRFFASA